MKTSGKTSSAKPSTHRRTAAYTLVEMMVGMGIFLGVFVGVMLSLQLFGLRVYTLAATKLTATQDARSALNALRNNIRSAKQIHVGNYGAGGFSRIPDGDPQTGNALELFFPDPNNNDEPGTSPTIYYQHSTTSTNALFSVTNNTVKMLANYVTNNYVFTAEDYQAKTLTTFDNNPVIRITLQFYQWQYPIGVIGGSNSINAYNHYRLQTRVGRRAKQ
jgi:type II secretory pathway pseudopilin PulG